VTGVRAGESGRIYSGTVDPFSPIIEHFHEPVHEAGEGRGPDSLTELLDCREMRDFIEIDLLSERVHDFDEFCRVSVSFGPVSFRRRSTNNRC
jgi:hypothetical protein